MCVQYIIMLVTYTIYYVRVRTTETAVYYIVFKRVHISSFLLCILAASERGEMGAQISGSPRRCKAIKIVG